MDFEKLKAFEMPFIEKEFYIAGSVQKVKIFALHDSVGLYFTGLDEKDPKSQVKAVEMSLVDSLRITEEEAKLLCKVDFVTAREIFEEAANFTKEYQEKRKIEREKALKNFKTAQQTNMAN